MSSKSETLAFEPTPAISSSNTAISALNDFRTMTNPNAGHVGHAGFSRRSKDVRFSPATSPQPRAHSLATSVPFLEPISSASTVPSQQQWPRNNPQAASFDMNGYMEHCKAIYERQRKGFEEERQVFEEERKLWKQERQMLIGQIAKLKLEINQKAAERPEKRRHSNDAPSSSLATFRSSFSLSTNFSGNDVSGPKHPVWETPDHGTAVTRVFSNEKHHSKRPDLHLPSISESSVSTLDGAMSPIQRQKEFRYSSSVSIPIEKVDSQLDGINLKSSGLHPSLVAKVISPDASSPNTPSPRTKTPTDLQLIPEGNGLQLPEPPHLKTNAGHTPLAFDGSFEPSKEVSNASTPLQPALGAASPEPRRPPNERADSYFAGVLPSKSEVQDQAGAAEPPGTVAPNEDPELKGPLMLDSEPTEGAKNDFLDELDKRLEQARHEEEPGETKEVGNEDDDDMPKLKLRKSFNFGSAFGSGGCGNMR